MRKWLKISLYLILALVILFGLVFLFKYLKYRSELCVINAEFKGIEPASWIVVNRDSKIDSIKLDKSLKIKYSYLSKKGDPDFVYFYYKSKPIVSLLPLQGEHISLLADSLSTINLNAGIESKKLTDIERAKVAFQRKLDSINSLYSGIKQADTSRLHQWEREISSAYVKYYRNRLTYMMNNCKSLSSVSLVYQEIRPSVGLFSQLTDAYILKNLADSLSKAYPKSKYIPMIYREANRRENELMLRDKLTNAKLLSYVDVNLPDINAKIQRLSEQKSKLTLLYFWNTEPQLAQQNVEILLPLYNKYKSKGLGIFSVCLDEDKSRWATIVSQGKFPWINVCDNNGLSSQYINAYVINKLPMAYLLKDDKIIMAIRNVNDIPSAVKKNI